MSKTELRDLIRSDLYRYAGAQSLRAFLATFRRIPAFRYTWLLRKCSYHHNRGLRFAFHAYNAFLKRSSLRYGFQIPFTCSIGRGLYLGHFGSVVVNPGATIGDNVNIANGVTIGQTNRGKRMGVPVIGSRVWIGTNAVVVGGVAIGNNVLIAPLAFVNFDVPDNAVVAGNPAAIISYRGTEGYVNRTV